MSIAEEVMLWLRIFVAVMVCFGSLWLLLDVFRRQNKLGRDMANLEKHYCEQLKLYENFVTVQFLDRVLERHCKDAPHLNLDVIDSRVDVALKSLLVSVTRAGVPLDANEEARIDMAISEHIGEKKIEFVSVPMGREFYDKDGIRFKKLSNTKAQFVGNDNWMSFPAHEKVTLLP